MKHCTVLPIKDQGLCMLEVLKVVFVAFAQHCIQTNVTRVGGVKSVLCIQWPFTPVRREGYLSLPSWGFRCSPPVRSV